MTVSKLKTLLGDSTNFDISLNGLSPFGAQGSAFVDNSVNNYIDALVSMQVKTTGGSLDTDPRVNIYVYGVSYNGSFPEGLDGTNQNISINFNTNIKLIHSIAIDSDDVLVISNPFHVASAFGGFLPEKWGIVVDNKTGLNLASSSNAASYIGVNVAQYAS